MSGDNINFFLKTFSFEKEEVSIGRSSLIINMIFLKLPLAPIIVNSKAQIIAGVEIIQSVQSFINNEIDIDLSESLLGGSQKTYFKDLSFHIQRKIYEYVFFFEKVEYKNDLIKQYFGR